MGIKRIVDTNFWNDDKVIEYFSPEDKLFMLYLMTNPHTTQLGIYSINKKHMSFELGYTIDTINVLLERFENKYKVIRYNDKTREIAIKNYLKYSIIKGGKPVEDLLIKEINQVKDKTLLQYIYNNIYNYSNLNETVKNILYIFNNKNDIQKQNDNDNDNEVSYHDSYNDSSKEIIEYLNNKLNSNYRANNKATQKHIKARLQEGFTIDDFKTVIDKQYDKWIGTDMQQYLRPETLFGTKFESYLNALNKVKNNNLDFVEVAREMEENGW